MSNTPDRQPPAEPGEHRATPPNGSLSPKPGNLAIAFLLVLLLFANLYADAKQASYDGKYMTFAVIGLIAAVLGVDVSRFWRGKGDE